jgi:hypothetical protein
MNRKIFTAIAALMGFLAILLAAVLALPAANAVAGMGGARLEAEAAELPPEDPARGLIYDGLVPGREGGLCEGLFEIRSDKGELEGCTDGPDPAPAGIDVREPRSLEEFLADTSSDAAAPLENAEPGTTGPTPPVPCIGDGTSGNRVQAIYAHARDRENRAAQWVPLIRRFAARVNKIFYESAKETGGRRNVRFVTDAKCELAVEVVELPETGDDSFADTKSALRALGHTRSDRKYLVWMDGTAGHPYTSGPLCGIAERRNDENPAQQNLNNGHASVQGMIARIDLRCWGGRVEAHELMHTLGAVQHGAPNSTRRGHCVDEFDRMCYDDDMDAPGVSDGFVRVPCFSLGGCWENKEIQYKENCPASHEERFDCNHEDYFHTSPPSGSYLATHWNTADSSFLIDHDVDDRNAPEITAPEWDLDDEQPRLGSIRFELWWSARDLESGVAAHYLWVRVDGGAWSKVTLSASRLGVGAGTWVQGSAKIDLSPGRRYEFAVRVVDAGGNGSAWAYEKVRFLAFDESSASYSGSWSTVSSSEYIGGTAKRTNSVGSDVRFSFDGPTYVAWIGTEQPSGGDADVYLDGSHVGRLSQNRGVTRFRSTMFATPVTPGYFGNTLTIRAAGGGDVDVDRFIVMDQ